MTYFTYNAGKDITGDGFRISPSQLSRFFDETSKWFREFLLEEEGFQGNTGSTLGTIVHGCLHMCYDNGTYGDDLVEEYLATISNPEIDKDHIRNQYPSMVAAALPFLEQNRPTEMEKFVAHEVMPDIWVGGSIDAIRGDTIYDFKTTSSKTPPKGFSRPYWFQQMAYAWVLKQQGADIRFIKLLYITQADVNRVSEKTGKALKDYPSTLTVVPEEVTQEKLDLIGSCIDLVAESVQTFKSTPELRHLLAQDNRLKVKPKPVLFKKD